MTPAQRITRSSPRHRVIECTVHRINGKPIAGQIANGFVLTLAAIAIIAILFGGISLVNIADQITEGMSNV